MQMLTHKNSAAIKTNKHHRLTVISLRLKKAAETQFVTSV